MTKKHGIVFSGGRHYPHHPFYKKLNNEYIICADSGLDSALNEGLSVDMVIGDLDSISPRGMEAINKANINFYESNKGDDLSDTELAINYLIKHEFDSIDVINSIGTRVDHSLVNITTLLKYEGLVNSLRNPYSEIKLLNEELITDQSCIVSIIPLLGTSLNVDIIGFNYGAEDTKIEYATSIGISNSLNKETGTIRLKEGKALLIKSWEESNE